MRRLRSLRRLAPASVILFRIFGFATSAWAVTERVLPEPLEALERRVVEQALPNGLHVVILPRQISPTVAVNILFRVGGIDEPAGRSGIAHLLEHMMFKGTTTLGTKDYAQERELLETLDRQAQALLAERAKGSSANAQRLATLERLFQTAEERHAQLTVEGELWELYTRQGADSLNAGTGLDLTSYVLRLPANKLELWALLDSDRLRHPVFRGFYKELEVVKEERRLRIESDPEGRLWEAFLAAAFTAHPYGRPTIGWMADLDRLTRQGTAQFFQTQYVPHRAAIAVVGDVEPPRTLALIQRYFGGLPLGPAEKPSERITPEPPQVGERRVVIEWDAEPRLLMGYHKPSWPHRDDVVCEIIEQMVAKGRTARFYKTLVEGRRLATTVAAYSATPGIRSDNLFVVEGVPRHPHTVEQLESAVEMELQRVAHGDVSAQELAKVKQQLTADFIRALQSDGGMAWQLAQAQALTGDWRSLLTRYRTIQTVTVEDVQRVAQTYFVRRNKTVAVLVKPRG